MCFKLTWRMHLLCFIMACMIAFLMSGYINQFAYESIINNEIPRISADILADFFIFLFILLMIITVVHELLHALAYKILGRKVKIGFKGIYAYTQDITNKPIHRTKFLIVLMTPVVTISIISLMIPIWGGLILIINLLGSTGDILMASYLCKSTSESYIIDKSYGFDIIDYKII